MKLKDLILNNLNNYEVIEKIAEVIRHDLVNNQKLSDKKIKELDNTLEVLTINSNSSTLLGDYFTLEHAIKDVIEKEISISFEKNDLSGLIEKEEFINNIETNINKPLIAKKINKIIDKLSKNYQSCKLLDNRELYFYNNEFNSNDNESIILTPLFFTNNDYYTNYLHDQSNIDFELIESDDFTQRLFLLENTQKVKQLIDLNNKLMEGVEDRYNIINKCSDIIEEFQSKCLKKYEVEFEIDNFQPLGYGTSFLEAINDKKITLDNLYEVEKQKYKKILRNFYER